MNNILNAGHTPTILVVDDTLTVLSHAINILEEQYTVKAARDGNKALQIANSHPLPDLILLDVMMPDIDGYAVCRRLKENVRTADIPIIFLTAKDEIEDETKGFALGAADYIAKPINPAILLARVRTHIALKASTDFFRNKTTILEKEVIRRTKEIRAIKETTIVMMASLAETRDNETGNHILRTQRYVRALASALRNHPCFENLLTESYIDLLFKSAPLHDIGKVGIPDRILLKPSRLNPEEFEIMKTHTTLGRDAIEAAEHRLGRPVAFLQCAKDIAYSHQEKWDGSGYPLGLAAEDIPVSARLMSVADVYDALISRRVYKPPMQHDSAVKIILEGRGRHFDPAIVDAFRSIHEEFRTIAARFTDFEAVQSEIKFPK